MKIAIRGGHNYNSTGAKAILDEVTEDRKVKDAVIKYLTQEGHEVLDCTSTSNEKTQNDDLAYGVDKANNWKADVFISIHFNNAYDKYDGELGSETLIYGTGGQAEKYAQRIVDKLVSVGFKNRGVKVEPKLYELRKTDMPAVITEVCFVEASKDVELYRKLGPDAIGKLIAEGILGKTIVKKPEQTKDKFYRVITGSYKDRKTAEEIKEKLEKQGYQGVFLEVKEV